MSDKPIQLITEKFNLAQESIEFLHSLKDINLSIISIIGPIYTGKSFIINQLINNLKNGFEIGDIENRNCNCTKGVFIWGNPIKISDDHYVLIIDTEGFYNEENSEKFEFDKKIFSLIMLISNIVIYNIKKDVDDNDNISDSYIKENLEFFEKLSSNFCNLKLEEENSKNNNNNNNNINKDFIPKILILNRDFNIEITKEIPNKFKEISQSNNFNNFNKLFLNNCDYFTLPCPMDENQMLLNAFDMEEENIFDENFLKKFEILNKKIFWNISPKYINNIKLNGNILYGLLQDYSIAFSTGENPFILTPLKNAIISELSEVSENINNISKDDFENNVIKKENIFDKIKNFFEYFKNNLFKYNNSNIGKNINCQYIIDEIINKFLNTLQYDFEKNIKDSFNNINENIKKLIEDNNNNNKINIQNINDSTTILNNFIKKIENDFNLIFFENKNLTFPFNNLLKEFITNNLIKFLNDYSFSLEDYMNKFTLTSKDENDKKNQEYENLKNEIKNKIDEINKLKNDLENINRENEINKKEYENNINIEKVKYENLEKHNNELNEIKDKNIKDLENKIDKINNELTDALKDINNKDKEIAQLKDEIFNLKNIIENNKNEINNQKENNNINNENQNITETQNNNENIQNNENEKNNENENNNGNENLKQIFSKINITFREYLNVVNKLEENKNIVFKNKFIEYSTNNLNELYKSYLTNINNIKQEWTNIIQQTYSDKLNVLTEENKKLNSELEKFKLLYKTTNNDFDIYKAKSKNLIENLELNKNSENNKENLIKEQKEIINLLQKDKNEKKKKIEILEIDLNTNKTSLKMKEYEIDLTISLLQNALDKNYTQLNINLNKLSKEYKHEIEKILKSKKLIK